MNDSVHWVTALIYWSVLPSIPAVVKHIAFPRCHVLELWMNNPCKDLSALLTQVAIITHLLLRSTRFSQLSAPVCSLLRCKKRKEKKKTTTLKPQWRMWPRMNVCSHTSLKDSLIISDSSQQHSSAAARGDSPLESFWCGLSVFVYSNWIVFMSSKGPISPLLSIVVCSRHLFCF